MSVLASDFWLEEQAQPAVHCASVAIHCAVYENMYWPHHWRFPFAAWRRTAGPKLPRSQDEMLGWQNSPLWWADRWVMFTEWMRCWEETAHLFDEVTGEWMRCWEEKTHLFDELTGELCSQNEWGAGTRQLTSLMRWQVSDVHRWGAGMGHLCSIMNIDCFGMMSDTGAALRTKRWDQARTLVGHQTWALQETSMSRLHTRIVCGLSGRRKIKKELNQKWRRIREGQCRACCLELQLQFLKIQIGGSLCKFRLGGVCARNLFCYFFFGNRKKAWRALAKIPWLTSMEKVMEYILLL